MIRSWYSSVSESNKTRLEDLLFPVLHLMVLPVRHLEVPHPAHASCAFPIFPPGCCSGFLSKASNKHNEKQKIHKTQQRTQANVWKDGEH